MLRVLLLAAAGAIVFSGFATVFLLEPPLNLLIAIGLVSAGAGLLWVIEVKTRRALEQSSALNKILNTDA